MAPEEEEKPHVVARDHRCTGVGQGVDLRRRSTVKLPAAKQEAFVAVCIGFGCGLPLATCADNSLSCVMGCPAMPRPAKWVKAHEWEAEKQALVCDCCCSGKQPIEPERALGVHASDTTCCLCDGGFLSRVVRSLHAGLADGTGEELEPLVSLFRIAHMTTSEYLVVCPKVVDCRGLLDLGKDSVQAENCLAGIDFCFRSKKVHPLEIARVTTLTDADDRCQMASLLFDPVTGLFSADWHYSSVSYVDLACYASLEEAVKAEEVWLRQGWMMPTRPPFAEMGLVRSNPVACIKYCLCLLQVCQLGARCITRCPSVRVIGQEDTACVRWMKDPR